VRFMVDLVFAFVGHFQPNLGHAEKHLTMLFPVHLLNQSDALLGMLPPPQKAPSPRLLGRARSFLPTRPRKRKTYPALWSGLFRRHNQIKDEGGNDTDGKDNSDQIPVHCCPWGGPRPVPETAGDLDVSFRPRLPR
jgi:hypothetical protein